MVVILSQELAGANAALIRFQARVIVSALPVAIRMPPSAPGKLVRAFSGLAGGLNAKSGVLA
jgi:hypothetical protein